MFRLLSVLLLLAGASLPVLANGASALQPVTLQLNWKHQFQFAGYYAAIERGFYREAGFDVRLQEVQGGHDPIDAVLSGAADYGVGASELALRRGQGQPVVVLATILQHSPLVLIAIGRSGASVHELVDKRVMLLPKMNLESARGRAEHWRRMFAEMEMPVENGKLRCTLSVGIAVFPDHGTSAEELLRNGDRALYLANALARNRVVTYDLGGREHARDRVG